MKKLIVITYEDYSEMCICTEKLKKDRIKHATKVFNEFLKYSSDGSYEITIRKLIKDGELHKYYSDLVNPSS